MSQQSVHEQYCVKDSREWETVACAVRNADRNISREKPWEDGLVESSVGRSSEVSEGNWIFELLFEFKKFI